MPFLKKHWLKGLFLAAVGFYLATAIAGCVTAKRLEPIAMRFSDYFYASFNAGDFNRMYETGAFEGCSKCTIKLDKFKGIMEFVMARLGPARSWKRTGYAAGRRGAYTRIVINFTVARERGESRERIVIDTKGEEWLVTDYTIASERLKRR